MGGVPFQETNSTFLKATLEQISPPPPYIPFPYSARVKNLDAPQKAEWMWKLDGSLIGYNKPLATLV